MATLRALICCDRGATALEFSLILPALLLFVVGSIEAAIILFIGSSDRVGGARGLALRHHRHRGRA